MSCGKASLSKRQAFCAAANEELVLPEPEESSGLALGALSCERTTSGEQSTQTTASNLQIVDMEVKDAKCVRDKGCCSGSWNFVSFT